MRDNKKILKKLCSCAVLMGGLGSAILKAPIPVKADTSAVTEVGISFEDGTLSLIAVPNFDFGAHNIDSKTRFIPLVSSARTNVADVDSGAYIDTEYLGGFPQQKLRDPSHYRALIVSDSRLPVNTSGTYNGWNVSAYMEYGRPSDVDISNSNIEAANPNGSIPDSNGKKRFAAAIELGNGFDNNSYTINSLNDGQSGNMTKISHPATYYNPDPLMKGTGGGEPQSVWTRVDSSSNTTADGLPADNSSSSPTLSGVYFPRLAVTPRKNSSSQVTQGLVANVVSPGYFYTDNPNITTIPQNFTSGGRSNVIWGYTNSQQNDASINNPSSVSNGAWALDFQDPGSAIMSLPTAVMGNRPGTYFYDIYWTLSSGFMSNPS